MSIPRSERTLAARAVAQQQAAELHTRKLHAIAERRAKAAKLSKQDFIAEIVKGKYRPITAEDIKAEPDPQ